MRVDEVQRGINSLHIKSHLSKYSVGEIVAIAQCYEKILDTLPEPDVRKSDGWISVNLIESAGFQNKMFVKAELMPHQIEILDTRIERLQDITDEDCIKEGIEEYPFGWVYIDKKKKLSGGIQSFSSPQETFASLIDKVSGKGTWASNPYVFVYDFKKVFKKEVTND